MDDNAWREAATRQDGVISRGQLQEHGLSPRAVTRMVHRNQLSRVVHGHFLVGGAPLTYAAKRWVAALSTAGLIGYETAADIWGWPLARPEQVHVCVDHLGRSRGPLWLTVHRVDVPGWARTQRDGLAVTTKAWTLLDLIAAAPTRSEASALMDRGLQQGWITLAAVERRITACPGRYGNARLRELSAQLGDGAAAQSERLLHQILNRAGVTGWRPNFLVALPDQSAYIDVAFPELRLAIEVDGWAHHSDVARFRGDRQRQNALVTAGWTVLRFTWADLTERPEYVLATILNFGAQMVAQ